MKNEPVNIKIDDKWTDENQAPRYCINRSKYFSMKNEPTNVNLDDEPINIMIDEKWTNQNGGRWRMNQASWTSIKNQSIKIKFDEINQSRLSSTKNEPIHIYIDDKEINQNEARWKIK